jgi:hypothetical protein
MNFIKAMLQQLDLLWSLWTIPALLIAGTLLINALPIPTLIVLGIFIYGELAKADFVESAACFSSGDDELPKQARKLRISAASLTIACIVAYSWFIHVNMTNGALCRDYTDDIPGMLPALLQKIVPHTCP